MSRAEDTPTPVIGELSEAALKEDDPERIGDRYIIEGRLGQGGMGIVYLAHDPVINRRVAIKVIPFKECQEEQYARFQQEARAAGKLNHPGIVVVLDFGLTDAEIPFLVMEYIVGATLAGELEKTGILEFDDFLSLFGQIAEAMNHAHSKGIIHRDLKPSNIVLGEKEGSLKASLLDFGVAKILTEDHLVDTKSGQIIGSPAYISPEQIENKEIDARTDIYAMGCVMFEALTGSPPFQGSSDMETFQMHLKETPPTLAERSSRDFSVELEQLVRKALAKSPDERHQSMKELKLLLDTIPLEGVTAAPAETATGAESTGKGWIIGILASLGLLAMAAVYWAVGGSFDTGSQDRKAVQEYSQKRVIIEDADSESDFIEVAKSTHARQEQKSKLKLLGRLRKGSKLRTVQMRISYLKQVEDSDLVNLPRYSKLSDLDLSGTSITKDAIPIIAKCSRLKYLRLSQVDLHQSNLGQLQALPRLAGLELFHCSLADSDIDGLCTIESIEILSIGGNRDITDKGFARISQLPKLKFLDINDTAITESGLSSFKGCRNLEIRIHNCNALKGIDSQQMTKTLGVKAIMPGSFD